MTSPPQRTSDQARTSEKVQISGPLRTSEDVRNSEARMSEPQRTSEDAISLGWLDALTRHRKIAFAILFAVYVASFNGLWRIGVDSALYRGLARSIARGDGYVFAGEHHTHAFAGLPTLLAGLQRLFGDSPVPALIMVWVMGLATLWLVDATIRLRYPLWMATVITLGVGLNYRFVRQSQELMTDIPFALGMMMAVYAYERLKMTMARREILRVAATLVAGLGLAAATRPTFGVLVVAMILASAYAVIRNAGGKRNLHLCIIGAAGLIAILLVLVDPRTAISAPFDGQYELELREAVRDLSSQTTLDKFKQLIQHDLNDAFFSQDMSPLAIPVALAVLVSAAIAWRRSAFWGLMIFGLVFVTLLTSTVPRYFIMVMPMMWFGWLVMLSWVTLKSPQLMRGAVMLIGVGVPLALNFGRDMGFVWEQHAGDWQWLRHGTPRQDAFYARYRGGAVQPLLGIAKMLRDSTTRSDKIVGPSANVLAYFADRRVVGERTLFFEKAISTYPSVLQKFAPDYAVFPVKRYDVTDPWMRDLIKRRIMVPMRTVATAPGDAGYLARVVVRLPPDTVKWTSYTGPAELTPTTQRITAAERAELLRKKARKLELEKREKKDKRAKIERREKLERRDKIERREKLERRAKLDRREKIDRQKKIAARERREAREVQQRDQRKPDPANATQPATQPVSKPGAADARIRPDPLVLVADFPLIDRPPWLLSVLPGAIAPIE